MLDAGDDAPEVTAPMATPEAARETDRGSYTSGDVSEFSLADALDEGPVVLAFYPGVYSRTCTQELCELRDWKADLAEADAPLYGVSADTPWSLLAFIDEYDLQYPLVSGFNNSIIADFGVRRGARSAQEDASGEGTDPREREESIVAGIANRAVFVVAPDGTVSYTWLATEPLTFPDTDEVEAAVAEATR
ncbi:redoxin domain-containing protein [Halobaculum roseum]|uniref:Redoxin domain-containing protein n=1 Tax=Halobaculum roseum TaxID=2175149 RepID=A0ABD5MQH8_9EURY|nr:redoxin domain-containing protein [Halobaculum roseum]QZY03924.1 redoxin domain-containing protein [Halobaculum roseum]